MLSATIELWTKYFFNLETWLEKQKSTQDKSGLGLEANIQQDLCVYADKNCKIKFIPTKETLDLADTTKEKWILSLPDDLVTNNKNRACIDYK